MKPVWMDYGKSWDTFTRECVDLVGVQVKIRRKPEPYLIGHINRTGECDGLMIEPHLEVVQYRRLLAPPR